MERLLIKNIRYLYCMDEEDTFLENADIYIEGNVIKKIGTKLDVPADGVKVIDGIIFIRILPEIFRSCRREIFWAGFFTHTEHGKIWKKRT